MSINWFASLKDVAWEQVLAVAPSIVERGKKIWSKSTDREAQVSEAEISTVLSPPVQGALTGPEALAAFEIRVRRLERRTAGLQEESVASFEVVHSLAGQHSELVHAVDVLLIRTRVLLRVCVVLGLAVAALFVVESIR